MGEKTQMKTGRTNKCTGRATNCTCTNRIATQSKANKKLDMAYNCGDVSIMLQ